MRLAFNIPGLPESSLGFAEGFLPDLRRFRMTEHGYSTGGPPPFLWVTRIGGGGGGPPTEPAHGRVLCHGQPEAGNGLVHPAPVRNGPTEQLSWLRLTSMTVTRLLDILIPSRTEQRPTESLRLALEKVFGPRPATDLPSDDALR